MVGLHLGVDAEGMKQRSESLDTEAANVANYLQRLQDNLAAYDGCWGNDQAGQNFNGKYSVQSGYITDGLTGAFYLLKGLAYSVRMMSEYYDKAEEIAKESVDNLSKTLEWTNSALDQDKKGFEQDKGSGSGSQVHAVGKG